MVATRRSASPSLSEGSTMSATTSGKTTAKKVVFAASVVAGTKPEEVITTTAVRRRQQFSKPPKKFVKGTGHIHFHKKAPTVTKHNKGGLLSGGTTSTEQPPELVQRVKLMTGTLYIYKGRKAEFVRTK